MNTTHLKQSNVSSLTNNMASLKHSQSYNELLNLRSTLLHMQYLYSSLSLSLERQNLNQQNQHKDHLIQCFNLKEQFEELKKNNFTKLLIVKLEEFLALEEELNEKLIQQPASQENKNKKNMSSSYSSQLQSSQVQFTKQFELIPKLDKFLTYVEIKEQQMQQSLCKLYIGNKVLIDLQKTSQSIQKVQEKIDSFMQKNHQTIKLYNNRVSQLDSVKNQFKAYLKSVQEEVAQFIVQELNLGLQNQMIHSNQIQRASSKPGRRRIHKLYEVHVKQKLLEQNVEIQKRIKSKRDSLLNFN